MATDKSPTSGGASVERAVIAFLRKHNVLDQFGQLATTYDTGGSIPEGCILQWHENRLVMGQNVGAAGSRASPKY